MAKDTPLKIPPVDIVIFGGHGDLALRKIMPALYYLFWHDHIDPSTRIFSTIRTQCSDEEHRDLVREKFLEYHPENFFSEESWVSTWLMQ